MFRASSATVHLAIFNSIEDATKEVLQRYDKLFAFRFSAIRGIVISFPGETIRRPLREYI